MSEVFWLVVVAILGAWLLTELSYAVERKIARMVAAWELSEGR